MQENEADVTIKEEKGNGKVYEVGYLLVPSLSEEEVPAQYTAIKDMVASFGGELIADEMPKMINLAYSMQKVVSNVRSKFNTAYFGWVKFVMGAAEIIELKKKLDLDPKIVRFLILKTVKENTIASKRFIRGEYKRPMTKKTGENEVATPIDEKEIDKEIDALVAA